MVKPAIPSLCAVPAAPPAHRSLDPLPYHRMSICRARCLIRQAPGAPTTKRNPKTAKQETCLNTLSPNSKRRRARCETVLGSWSSAQCPAKPYIEIARNRPASCQPPATPKDNRARSVPKPRRNRQPPRLKARALTSAAGGPESTTSNRARARCETVLGN